MSSQYYRCLTFSLLERHILKFSVAEFMLVLILGHWTACSLDMNFWCLMLPFWMHQMIVSTSLLYVLRKLDVIRFTDESKFKRFVPTKIIRETSPLSIAYLFYMVSLLFYRLCSQHLFFNSVMEGLRWWQVVGMASIRGVSVPMYTTLRRTTVLFTMVMEFFLVGQRHTTPVITRLVSCISMQCYYGAKFPMKFLQLKMMLQWCGSVAIIVFGVFIAAARDFSFELGAYSLVFLSNLTTAVYLATISRLGTWSKFHVA